MDAKVDAESQHHRTDPSHVDEDLEGEGYVKYSVIISQRPMPIHVEQVKATPLG